MAMDDDAAAVQLAQFTAPADLPVRRIARFDDLVNPLTKTTFVERFWGRAPFFIKRNSPGYFDSLISLDDVDEMLSSTAFFAGELRVAKDGVVLPTGESARDEIIDRNYVWSHYLAGATVVFEHLNRKHSRLLRVMSACEEDFRVPFRANAYLTPPASRGFDLHYDTHDVLILQVAGSKRWQVHDNPLLLPHEDQTFRSEWAQRSRRLAEITLEPGDVLYLPRGFVHSASANEATSFHVTVGIRSVTLRDLYQTALRRALVSDPAFRSILLFRDIASVAETAKQELAATIDAIDVRKAARDADLSFLKKRARPLDGRLDQLLGPLEIRAGTAMRRSTGALFLLTEDQGKLVVSFDRRRIQLPLGTRPALEMIARRTVFTPEELPGLEAHSRVLLAAKLYECRLLDVVSPQMDAMRLEAPVIS
jgi:ribosomal protein L16 Arg81 hydroxylase